MNGELWVTKGVLYHANAVILGCKKDVAVFMSLLVFSVLVEERNKFGVNCNNSTACRVYIPECILMGRSKVEVRHC